MDHKKFILQSLRKYAPSVIKPTKTNLDSMRDLLFGKDKKVDKREILHLANPEIFKNPSERYKITGEKDPTKALHRIFDEEITSNDRTYLIHLLDKETDDVFIPPELIEEFAIGHRRHHQNLLLEERAPKAPFYLFLGPTGSGKTKTVNRAIERALFNQELEIKYKVDEDLEGIIERHPIMARIDLAAVAPEAAERIGKEKRRKKLKFFSTIPILKDFYKEETAEVLKEEKKEFGMSIDKDQINPNNVQTMWYGETGNKMMTSFGSKGAISIRVLEEAHALLRVHESRSAQVQEDTLVSTFNIIMDEIEKGERNCMVVALTRRGEEFHEDIFRRFQEKGRIIDMSDYWKNPETIEELIKIEVKQQDVEMPGDVERKDLANKVLQIFEYRDLDLTPAYVRKLLASIIEEKKQLLNEYLDDGVLVRRAFVNVARNLYPEMFKKTYNKMVRNVEWGDYVGDIKEEFQRSANQRLIHNLSTEKGVILAGPPGSGKTFLARAYLSRNKDIADITLSIEDLQDDRDPIDGPVRKLAESIDIAKMCAPSVYFVDEGDTIAMERQGNSIQDRIPNKLLNAISGENEIKGVFFALTTNNPERLAEAAKRSGRLRVMTITGKLTERDIYKLLGNYLKGEVVSPEISEQRVYSIARKICSTPADYSAFFETIVNFKNEEREIIKFASKTEERGLDDFIISNYKALIGIVESLGFSSGFVNDARRDISFLINNKDVLMVKVREAVEKNDYPITIAHLDRAHNDRMQAPRLKGKISLDDYLESQLSSEPQVGMVIGAGASDTSGLLVPIRSSIIYDGDNLNEKTVVTGAVPVNAPQAAELNAAVEMVKQSAKEALTLVLNYLDSLFLEKDVKRVIGTYLKNRHFHHQFLTAQYMSGGPSAGMALAINTLSSILELPVRHDFGITGAPWSGGKTKKDTGSAVIIGGADNKSQIVLSYLNRMYIPVQNMKDINLLTLEGFWKNGKDIVGYENFPSIIGEVYCLDNLVTNSAEELFEKRIEAKRLDLVAVDDARVLFSEVDALSAILRKNAEKVITDRVGCIERYIRDGNADEFMSLEGIFKKYN
ncbi:MAG: AAA family ATPase [archaeon]